jgi:hypothetical protein
MDRPICSLQAPFPYSYIDVCVNSDEQQLMLQVVLRLFLAERLTIREVSPIWVNYSLVLFTYAYLRVQL